MRSALIDLYRENQSLSIDSDILLSTRPNLSSVIPTKPFKIISWDQYTRIVKLDECSCSFVLKLLPIFMTIVKSERVYPLRIGVLFLASIAIEAESLCDTHLWQFFKVHDLRQDVTNYELKYRITTI